MVILIGSLLIAGWTLIGTGRLETATVAGARSIAGSSGTPESGEVAEARTTEARPVANLAAVQDADEEEAPAEDGEESDDDKSDEDEPEEVKAKVKYVGAETDFEVEVITALPVEKGDKVGNGDLVLEVSTRPIFVFEGDSPATRSLMVGTTGIDVEQIERALSALGYNVGTIDDTFDAATAAAVAKFYEASGYALPEPSEKDLEDLADAQAKLEEAQLDRERLLVELADENNPDLVGANEDLFDLQEAQADLADIEVKLNELREERDAVAFLNSRFHALTSAITAGIATGDFDADDPESVTDALGIELDLLIGDKPKDFDTFDEMFAAIADERASVISDVDDAQADIKREEIARDLAMAAVDVAWDVVLEVPSTAKVDDIRLQLKQIDVALVNLHSLVAKTAAKTGARLSIDEFVFVPNLPGEIDDIEIDVRDEADGTLLKIITGG